MKPIAQKGSTGMLRLGWTLTVIGGLFMAFDATIHMTTIPAVVNGFAMLGFPLGIAIPLSVIELIFVILYFVPRTSVLGAILLTGYLGGAVAANVRIGNPFFADILAPVYVAAILWLGLYFRDERLRAVVPIQH